VICPRCQRETQPKPWLGMLRCMNGGMNPCGQELGRAPPPPPRKVLEKDVLRKAIAWLRLQGPSVHVERINVARFGPDGGRQYQSATKGSADLHVTVNGKALFVECKRPGGRQRPEQAKYQARVERAGCRYVIEDSPGLETLRKTVEEMRKCG
jgi:hypothetical protein